MIVAGTAAIIAGAAWLTWALLNIVTSGGLDSGAGVGFRMTKLGQLLTVLWNLLLIPSVIVFWNQLRSQNPNLILIYSVCGILSQVFWAIGAAARVNSPMLEVTYVLLSGIWWTGIGLAMQNRARWFAFFTVIVGCFALLDGVLSFLEPLPFYIYVFAAPKLPLAMVWDFWMGVSLLRTARFAVVNPFEK